MCQEFTPSFSDLKPLLSLSLFPDKGATCKSPDFGWESLFESCYWKRLPLVRKPTVNNFSPSSGRIQICPTALLAKMNIRVSHHFRQDTNDP